MFRIVVGELALDDLVSLTETEQDEILALMQRRLSENPAIYGKPLRSPLAGYWSLRAGKKRVVYSIHGSDVRVLVVGNRDSVYAEAQKRL